MSGQASDMVADRDDRLKPEIRLAVPSDLAPILAVDHMGTDSDRHEQVETAIRQGHCWMGLSDGRVVGYLVADTSFYGHPFVWLVVVAAPFRRLGVATALMRHVESLFPNRKLFTSTNESNSASRRLMESLGFERSGWIDNLDDADPEIIYVKRLASE